MGRPSVYPTGVTIYKKDKTFNGYTIFPTCMGATLIDMNGREVHIWKGLQGFPYKILPGGHVMGSTGTRNPKYAFQDYRDLAEVDWDGNILWKFSGDEFIEDPETEPQYMLRQHHDYQRQDSPTGYYSPGQPEAWGGNTYILTHTNLHCPEISDKLLLDDRVVEVTPEGKIVWEWKCSDHFGEFGFDGDAKNAIYRNPNMMPIEEGENVGDYLHINSLSLLGENRHYDAGDERFNPENLIMDSRESGIMFIVSKATGEIVWKLGPKFSTPAELKLQQIIGQHHFHMIPRGLEGEGNFLVFDNGGYSGYGTSNPSAPEGRKIARRHYSRVIEFDPITLEIVWMYSLAGEGGIGEGRAAPFFSALVSSAQRLPNGNTFITEGLEGRLFEVTSEYEIVWEYINPYRGEMPSQEKFSNMIYRAYRCPYSFVPQLDIPEEIEITPPDNATYRVPGSVFNDDADAVTIEVK